MAKHAIVWNAVDRPTRALSRVFLVLALVAFGVYFVAAEGQWPLLLVGVALGAVGYLLMRGGALTGTVDAAGVTKVLGRTEWSYRWADIERVELVPWRKSTALVVVPKRPAAGRTASDSLLWSPRVPRGARALVLAPDVVAAVEAEVRRRGLLH